jgi:hypothetical protein
MELFILISFTQIRRGGSFSQIKAIIFLLRERREQNFLFGKSSFMAYLHIHTHTSIALHLIGFYIETKLYLVVNKSKQKYTRGFLIQNQQVIL